MKRYPVIRAFIHFLRFAPKRILWVNFITIVQAGIASAGFILLIPLMQLAGLDISSYTAQHGGAVNYLVERLEQQAWTHSLEQVLLVYAVIMSLIALLSYHRSVLQVKIQQAYVRSMRAQLYQSILQAKWSFLATRRTAEYLHRVGAQVQTMNVSANQLINGMHQLVSMLIYIGLMFLVHPQFTLATIGVGCVLAIILIPVRYRVRDAGALRMRGYQEIFAILSEHLSNLKMIKASAREGQFSAAVETISEGLEEQQIRMQRAGAIVNLANALGLAIGFAVLLYIGVSRYQLPLAEFVLLMMVMSRILPRLAGLQQTAQGILYSLPAFIDLEDILLKTTQAREIDVSRSVTEMEFSSSIALQGVDFAYDRADQKDQKTPVFKNLNVEIKALETVALSGASGIGKSTIADLIASLLEPSSGQLLIDGKPLNQSTLSSWRRSLAYVTQEVYLFNDSVRNNLTWSAPDATDEELWQVLKLAAIDDHIRQLPKQLETRLGDRGARFSGGERQRLAIARALLTKPKLLILDEATSALDDHNEQHIHQVIESLRGQVTVLIIAHRQSTLGVADRVIDVNALRSSDEKLS